jgi:hypothetical protein
LLAEGKSRENDERWVELVEHTLKTILWELLFVHFYPGNKRRLKNGNLRSKQLNYLESQGNNAWVVG